MSKEGGTLGGKRLHLRGGMPEGVARAKALRWE